jgi:hypothetical protein
VNEPALHRSVLGSIDSVASIWDLRSSGRRRIFGRYDTVVVCGWAAGYEVRAAPDEVTIDIDGVALVSAALGLERVDVSAAIPDAMANLGFRAVIGIEPLRAGSHTISLTVRGGQSVCRFGETPLIVVDPCPVETTRSIYLDSPSGDIGYGDRIELAGWALDSAALGRSPTVVIVVDGRHVFECAMGFARPDVAAAFGLVDPYVGFTGAIHSAVLGPGRHEAFARVVSEELGEAVSVDSENRIVFEVGST